MRKAFKETASGHHVFRSPGLFEIKDSCGQVVHACVASAACSLDTQNSRMHDKINTCCREMDYHERYMVLTSEFDCTPQGAAHLKLLRVMQWETLSGL